MQMTENEILREYNQAKDKKGQVTILADMNMCEKEDIIKLLLYHGVPEEELPKPKPAQPKVTRAVKKKADKASIGAEPVKIEIKPISDPLQGMIDSLTAISEKRKAKIEREQMILDHILAAYGELMEARNLMKEESDGDTED